MVAAAIAGILAACGTCRRAASRVRAGGACNNVYATVCARVSPPRAVPELLPGCPSTLNAPYGYCAYWLGSGFTFRVN